MKNPRVLDPNKKRRYFERDGLVHVVTDWESFGKATVVYLPCEPVYVVTISPRSFAKTKEPRVPTCFVCALA